VAVLASHLSSPAHESLHSGSEPAQFAAAALAEADRILVRGSATRGAASAARAKVRAKTPLKARWSVLHLPLSSQADSMRMEDELGRKAEVLFTKPFTASVQFCAPVWGN
jgi:hypothetical protein